MITITLLYTILLTTFTTKNISSNQKIESIKNTSRIFLISLIYTIYLYLMEYQFIINDKIYILYNGLLMLNSTNYIITLLILIITIYYISIISNNITSIKYYDNIIYNKLLIIIIGFNTLGLILLTQINDIMLLFIIIELQSYSLYIITSLYNKSINTLKAGLYYFIVGSIGSLLILDSTISIYNYTGLTNIQYILTLFYSNNININILEFNSLNYSWLFIIIGIFIKLGLAPFYNYSIIIYTLAPTIITYYISLLPKLSLLTLLNLFLPFFQFFINDSYSYTSLINYINIFILLSLFIASIGGLNTIKIKTMLAYSSLLNLSFIIINIFSNSYHSLPVLTFIYYISQYSLIHILIFNIILILPIYLNINIFNNNKNNNSNNNSKNNNIILSKYSPIEFISQFKLLNNNTYLSISITIAFFSLIGIPPLIGYYAKLLVLINSIYNGQMLFTILIVITSSISILYYSNIIKTIWFNSTNKEVLINNNNQFKLLNNITYIISIITCIALFNYIEYINIIRGIYILLYN